MAKVKSCEKQHFCSRELGIEEERERIIKLIEGSIRECECASVEMTYCRHNWIQTDLIALIKGENK